jgi:Leucine-rich repeat (LRR) protein
LGEVGFTLRYLDMSHNHVEHLDSTMFPDTPYLLGLNLGHNKLTILPDNVFTSLGGLVKLDLSSNPLRANFKELFHYVQKLRHLSLADTGLKVTPHLPLPNLVTLNLSSNSIEELSAAAVEGLERLRSLYLNANRFVAVPSQAWPHMPLLKTLDISKNNIKVMLCASSAVIDSSLNKNFYVPWYSQNTNTGIFIPFSSLTFNNTEGC